jgi:hypothetical protein|tara:strand:- start:1042 stop:1209 length:168 start_codon:yes stop_codon:yes gene_type:complete
MGLEEIVPALALIAILILIFPEFISTNIKKKTFLKNLSIWGIIVLFLVILLYLVF